jgi:hypothetical protein
VDDRLEQESRDDFTLEDALREAFFDELDSWLGADKVLCRSCYDDFAKYWPGLVAEDSFQSRFMDIDAFYSGSRLQHAFSADEYSRLCELIDCDRCGGPVKQDFWAYNPMPLKMESDIDAIAKIASDTPFLVLRHPFAQRFLDLIDFLGQRAQARQFAEPYYRGRKRAGLNSREPDEFFPPPAEKVTEGRYNHNGQRVLYL